MEMKTRTGTFTEEISNIPGGEGINLCIHCGTCIASCPNTELMEHMPSQLLAMALSAIREKNFPAIPSVSDCPSAAITNEQVMAEIEGTLVQEI